MNASLKLQARTTQGLTARLRMAVRLLQLSSLDYEQELHDLASKNPFLEIEGSADARPPTPSEEWSPSASTEPEPPTMAEPDAIPAASERMLESDPWMQSASGVRDGGKDAPTSAVDLLVAEVDLRAHLREQVRGMRLSDRDGPLVLAIIESLDDDGFLRTPLDEIAVLAGMQPAADPGEIGIALRLVQSLEPTGVAARDIVECLRLQLDPEPADRHALACLILEGQLERLARRDTAGIAKATGRAAAEVEQACAAIRRLDPRPARRFDTQRVHYVVPDVVVRKLRGRWDVQLNAAAMPRLQLNPSTCELFQQHRNGANRELAGHLQEARWAVRNIEQRFSTILAVARSILKRQYGYFEHGPLAMKPLSLGEIAAEVGVHESTVCRVTNNKYMATPSGVIELKSFFSRPMALESGGASSGVAIRELVREMIEEEGGGEALSDGEIAKRLARQGINITRRTVTKYRGLLQLPAAEQRRRARSESHASAAATAGRRAAAEGVPA